MSAPALAPAPSVMGSRPSPRRRPAVEWPTLALVAGVYGGWLAVTASWHVLPLWLAAPVCAILVTWQSSLQHEILHGHPTRSRRVNRVLGMVPLSLWLPYERYRRSHLLHHVDERLTDPLDDPESYYWEPQAWRRLGPAGRLLVSAQTTLLGRIVIGPVWSVGRFFVAEAKAVRAGQADAGRVWAEHLAWCVPVVLWLTLACGIPLWVYLSAVVYPATGILLIRSFAEHRAAEGVAERTAIVEDSWILGPLFLFNNLHVVHHDVPNLPWYRLPGWYAAHRESLVAANGGLVYRTYWDVARRYLLWPHDGAVHPFGRVRRAGAQ